MADAINNTSFVPWGLHPLMDWIKPELERRASEVDMNPSTEKYSGPKTAWVRFFSNGVNKEINKNFEGFVMGGVNGFDDSYGFRPTGEQVIGYDGEGAEHTINASSGNTFSHRPPPSIESVEVSLYGGQNSSFSGLCRRAKVSWKCYNLDQLEYLMPYFMRPKVTALVEWGWNNYEKDSLIDLSHNGTGNMTNILLDGGEIMERIKKSKGNYDAMMGFIFDFSFSLNANGGYDCYTEFVNANWLIEGMEYKSTSRVKKTVKDGKVVETPLKSFIEFVDSNINNITFIKTENEVTRTLNLGVFAPDGKFFEINPKNSRGMMMHGKERKLWLRMDLVQDILNKFFSLTLESIENIKISPRNAMVLDISDTIMCGHPALKSVDSDVLVPNQYAPRLTTQKSEDEDKASRSKNGVTDSDTGSFHNVKISMGSNLESQDYETLFSKSVLLNTINSNELTSEYDDLQKLINPSGNSFPIFQPTGSSSPGTWGYLKDIYISTDLIKVAMAENDTAYGLLNSILKTINDALSGIVQLKIVSHQFAAKYSVIDTNYNPRSTVSSVKDLTTFTPGAVNSAYMTNAGMSIKLSQEMANQMVAQSSAGNSVNTTDRIDTRVGVQEASRFVGNDRLYERATVSDDTPSNSSPDDFNNKPSTINITRQLSNSIFNPYQEYKNGKKYLLTEPDREFMRSIVSGDIGGKIIYINSPMLSGTRFEMETLGIGGFTFLGQFTLDHVPKVYRYDNCVWQVADIKQTISAGLWKTNITADCRPLSYVGGKPVT